MPRCLRFSSIALGEWSAIAMTWLPVSRYPSGGVSRLGGRTRSAACAGDAASSASTAAALAVRAASPMRLRLTGAEVGERHRGDIGDRPLALGVGGLHAHAGRGAQRG